MSLIRRFPASFSLLFVNVIVFIVVYLHVNTFAEPEWTQYLLKQGAEFNPYTLDGQWYRIFNHMFLHGSILHLLFNMYALYSVGTEVESEVGFSKFLWVYFLCGIGAALVSLYWSLFTIGVGASGAIFGLFGFALVINLFRSRQLGHSLIPVLINFAVFLGINLLFAKAFHADTPAHMGGLFCGIMMGSFSVMRSDWLRQVRMEYAFIPLFVVIYFSLPRYQVTYFNFFQYVLAAEDSTQQIFGKNAPDAYYLAAFKKSHARWDTALNRLNAHTYLPKDLQSDTFKLRRYLTLRKQEDTFRITMMELESYIYMDSIEAAQDAMRNFYRLDYPLTMTRPKKEAPEPDPLKDSTLRPVKVLYDEDWEEIPGPPFTYYRMGSRDSLGRWQGSLRDFYANGDVQMKGTYKNDERDGIFIYYSDHKTYESAGRYNDDRNVGKWETYHNNGRLESEVYYTNRYFLKNRWDSAGNQLVKDGYGRVVEHHTNGIVSNEGEYRDGYKEGYWYGRYASGAMYYEENYNRGRLVNGRSRDLQGGDFIYDQSSFFALPEGGYQKLKEYIETAVRKSDAKVKGTVRLSFRVTTKSRLTDFKILRSVSRETDERAKQILREGPRWLPAKDHGDKKVDGFANAEIVF